MKVVFTKSNLPVSKLICWGLDEPVSHLAFVFDNKFVIQSSFFGVELQWLNTFIKHNDIIQMIEIPLTLEKEEVVYRSIIDNFDDSAYDYQFFFYLFWNGLLRKLFGKPLPNYNPYSNNGQFICFELLDVLPNWLLPVKPTKDEGVISPHKAYLWLKLYLEKNPPLL